MSREQPMAQGLVRRILLVGIITAIGCGGESQPAAEEVATSNARGSRVLDMTSKPKRPPQTQPNVDQATANHPTNSATINLLNAIDSERDTKSGEWKKQGGELVGGTSDDGARLELIHEFPPEYDLEISFTRIEQDEILSDTTIIFPASQSHRVLVVRTLKGAVASELFLYGKDEAEFAVEREFSSKLEPALKVGDRHTLQFKVREESLTVHWDGRQVVDVRDVNQLRAATKALGFGIVSIGHQSVYHKITLRPHGN